MPTEPDTSGNEPNLELPNLSLGFGRKKRRGRKSGDSATESTADDAQIDTPAAATDAAAEPQPGPAAPGAPRAPAAPPAPVREGARPAPARPAARPAARPPARPASSATPTPTPPTPPPTPSAPEPHVVPDLAPEPPPVVEQPEFDEPTTVIETAAVPAPLGDADAEETAVLEATEPAAFEPFTSFVDDEDADDEAAPAPRRSRTKSRAESRARRRAEKKERKERQPAADALVAALPPIKPFYAAFITGALSGLAAVALAIGASRGCEAVRDTSSCGGGFGLLAIVAIVAIEVLIGANLLKAWKISDPFSTSFLGVGLVAIIAMLIFLSELDSVWMLLVIPAMTAVAFVLSWWVTVRIIDEHPLDEDTSGAEADAEEGDYSDA